MTTADLCVKQYAAIQPKNEAILQQGILLKM
jgi:hypothetical protein